MLYINAKERAGIEVFRSLIYTKIKEEGLRYSDQRERVLKILYEQNYPVSIEYLLTKLRESNVGASYATVSRHIKFFDSLEILITVNKTPKGYLLKKSIENQDTDVVHYAFKKTQ
ncbi:MAG: transcriptional repressor [Campylobacterales bacterium]|nr:transcriptional repressor [Campylobacterales bacterium]